MPTVLLVGFQVAFSASTTPMEHHNTTGGAVVALGTRSSLQGPGSAALTLTEKSSKPELHMAQLTVLPKYVPRAN